MSQSIRTDKGNQSNPVTIGVVDEQEIAAVGYHGGSEQVSQAGYSPIRTAVDATRDAQLVIESEQYELGKKKVSFQPITLHEAKPNPYEVITIGKMQSVPTRSKNDLIQADYAHAEELPGHQKPDELLSPSEQSNWAEANQKEGQRPLPDEQPAPVKIGHEIVGTNHFEEYGIQISDQDSGVVASSNAHSPDPQEILRNFLSRQSQSAQPWKSQSQQERARNHQQLRQQIQQVAPDWHQRNARPRPKTIEQTPKISYKDTIKNSDQKQPLKSKNENFDLDQYEFYNEDLPFQAKAFKEKFRSAQGDAVNKKQVNRMITELIYTQLIDSMNKKQLPKIFRENQLRWCQLLVKSPKMQEFYVHFSDQLQSIMKAELIHNGDLFDMYMRQPRPDPSVSAVARSLSPSTNREPLHIEDRDEDFSRKFYPAIREEKAIFRRERRVNQALAQAKFNYQQTRRRKEEQRQQMVGMHKHLGRAVEAGQCRSIAEAARQANQEKGLSKMMSAQQKERENLSSIRARDKKKQQKQAPVMTEFQLQVKEAAAQIQELVDSIDDNNTDLRSEVTGVEAELDKLERDRGVDRMRVLCGPTPGDAVHQALQVWGDEELAYDEDIAKWSTEYWSGLAEYEKELRTEEKGFQKVYRNTCKTYDAQIHRLKSMYLFHTTALESALTEVKMTLGQQIEALRMTIADMESREMNKVKEVKRVNELLLKVEEGLTLRSVKEARGVIKDLARIVKGKDTELESKEKVITGLKKANDALEYKLEERMSYHQEEQRIRAIYQQYVLKMVRDLDLFQGDEERLNKLKAIHESENDLNYQRQIELVLRDINLQGALNAHVNRHYGRLVGLGLLKTTLQAAGVLPDPAKGKGSEDATASAPSISVASRSNQSSQKSLAQDASPARPRSLPKKQKLRGKKTVSVIAAGGLSFDEPPEEKLRRVQMQPEDNDGKQATARKDRRKTLAVVPEQTAPEPGSKTASKPQKTAEQEERPKAGHPRLSHAARQQLSSALESAIMGHLQRARATLESGKCTVGLEAARLKMVEVIRGSHPEELENFRFLKAGGLASSTPAAEGKSGTGHHKKGHKGKDGSKARKAEKDKKAPPSSKGSTHRPAALRGLPDDRGQLAKSFRAKNGSPTTAGHETSRKQVTKENSGFSRASRSLKPQSNDQTDAQAKQIQILNVEDKSQNTQRNKGSIEHDELKSRSLGSLGSVRSLSKGSQKARANTPPESPHRDAEGQGLKLLAHETKSQTSARLTEQADNLMSKPNKSDKDEEKSKQTALSAAKAKEQHSSKQTAGDQGEAGSKAAKGEEGEEAKSPSKAAPSKETTKKEAPASTAEEPAFNKDPEPTFSENDRSTVKLTQSQVLEEMKLNGVGAVHNELRSLINQRFDKLLAKSKKAQEAEKQDFQMNAQEVSQMQDLVQYAIGTELGTRDYNELFKPDIQDFFSQLNLQMMRQYKLEDINQIIDKQVNPPAPSPKAQRSQKKKTQISDVKFGDILKPNFAENGELLGFELRNELAPVLYANNDYDLVKLKRLVKVCMYINRLIRDGEKDDFHIKQVRDGAVVKEPKKEFTSSAVQVDEMSLQKNKAGNSDIAEEEEEGPITPRTKALNFFKDHCIDIASRMKPNKRTLQRLVWEDMDFDGLFNQALDNVYMDQSHQDKRKKLTFGEYLTTVLSHNMNRIYALQDEDKEFLKLEKLLKHAKTVQTKQRSTQTPKPPEKEYSSFGQQANIISNVDNKSIQTVPYDETFIMKKSKNQLILDKAMEQEFRKTLELFDEYANYFNKMDAKVFKNVPESQYQQGKTLFSQNNQDQNDPNMQGQQSSKQGANVYSHIDAKNIKQLRNSKNIDQIIEPSSEEVAKKQKPKRLQLDDLSAIREKLMNTIQHLKLDVKFQNTVIQAKQFTKFQRDYAMGSQESPRNQELKELASARVQKQVMHKRRDNPRFEQIQSLGQSQGPSKQRTPKRTPNRMQSQLRRHNQTAQQISGRRQVDHSTSRGRLPQRYARKEVSVDTSNFVSLDLLNIEAKQYSTANPAALTQRSQERKQQSTINPYHNINDQGKMQVYKRIKIPTAQPSENISGFSQHFAGVLDIKSTDLDSSSVSPRNNRTCDSTSKQATNQPNPVTIYNQQADGIILTQRGPPNQNAAKEQEAFSQTYVTQGLRQSATTPFDQQQQMMLAGARMKLESPNNQTKTKKPQLIARPVTQSVDNSRYAGAPRTKYGHSTSKTQKPQQPQKSQEDAQTTQEPHSQPPSRPGSPSCLNPDKLNVEITTLPRKKHDFPTLRTNEAHVQNRDLDSRNQPARGANASSNNTEGHTPNRSFHVYLLELEKNDAVVRGNRIGTGLMSPKVYDKTIPTSILHQALQGDNIGNQKNAAFNRTHNQSEIQKLTKWRQEQQQQANKFEYFNPRNKWYQNKGQQGQDKLKASLALNLQKLPHNNIDLGIDGRRLTQPLSPDNKQKNGRKTNPVTQSLDVADTGALAAPQQQTQHVGTPEGANRMRQSLQPIGLMEEHDLGDPSSIIDITVLDPGAQLQKIGMPEDSRTPSINEQSRSRHGGYGNLAGPRYPNKPSAPEYAQDGRRNFEEFKQMAKFIGNVDNNRLQQLDDFAERQDPGPWLTGPSVNPPSFTIKRSHFSRKGQYREPQAPWPQAPLAQDQGRNRDLAQYGDDGQCKNIVIRSMGSQKDGDQDSELIMSQYGDRE